MRLKGAGNEVRMKTYFMKKRIACVLFLVILILFSILNFSLNYDNIKSQVEKTNITNTLSKEYRGVIETALDENILSKYSFIEAYGSIQLLLGKYEVDNFSIVKDHEGVLYNTYFGTGVSYEINSVVDTIDKIRNIASNSGAEFLVVSPPDKFLNGVSHYRKGYPYNYTNENIDYFEELLRKKGIFFVELRSVFEKSNSKLEDIFYKTDHHWTTQASFVVFQQLVWQMEKHYNISLDKNRFFTDRTNYSHLLYQNIFLGSQGRKTGVTYSGLDDFILIYPNFSTLFTFTISSYDYYATGLMEDVIIDTSQIKKEMTIYEKDYYGIYQKGVAYPYGKISNVLNVDGPKVLAIRDSFSCVPLTFFASVCKEMDLIYPYEFDGNITELIEQGEYDYVMVFAYPGNMTNAFYNFRFH